MAPKKRRPGGGRKAVFNKVSTFSTRITAETRGQLDAAAAKTGLSVSHLAEKLISDGLKNRSDRTFVSNPISALAILIETVEHGSRGHAADGRVCEWSSDPTIFETFRVAIGKLLEKLRPPGDVDTSTEGPLVGQSPQERAEVIVRNLWVNLLSARPPITTKDMVEFYAHYGPASEELLATYGRVSQRSYQAKFVRKALNIPNKQEAEQ